MRSSLAPRATRALPLLFGSFSLISLLCACSSSDPTLGDDGNDLHGADGGDAGAGAPEVEPLPLDVALPIVFVHGFAGSAQQYQSQAMRFDANGYPHERIRAYEHDGAGVDFGAYVEGTSAFIDAVLAEFEVEQVFLVGHSRGTFVSSTYLESPERAAKVKKYVSLDGSGCSSADAAGVPCIAPNQEGLPGQAHVEVSTSAESFAMQYEFFVGEAPAVVDVVPQRGPVVISGRAVNFPQNTGRDGTTLQIWEIDAETGARVGNAPLETFELGADGAWGPVTVDPEKYYEKVLTATGSTSQHFYMQPYTRSTDFVRLLSGPPDSPTRLNTHRSDDHAAVIAIRMREWYGADDPDGAGDERDVLEIDTESTSGDRPAVNAITERTANGNIAIHIHDDAATPRESTLLELPNLGGAFQTTSDVFMPAASPPDGTITFRNLPRGDASNPQVLRSPNWASSEHIITLLFNDYVAE